MYFQETIDYFGTNKEIDLIENGSEILVDDQNKYEYVQRVTHFKLYEAIKTQMDAFYEGFYDLVPRDIIKLFDNRELELLISGLPNIDIDDLKENTIYSGYTAQSKPVVMLWEILYAFDNSERAEFVQFCTGSSKVPIEGFKVLRGTNGINKFQITKMQCSDPQRRLPQSHTCVN